MMLVAMTQNVARDWSQGDLARAFRHSPALGDTLIAGKQNVVVECNPLLGPQLMQATKDLVAGKTLPRRIVTVEGVFPREVAAAEFPKRQY